MNNYDFAKFIEGIKDLSWHEMIATANARCAAVESSSSGVRGAPRRRKEGSAEFAAKIKGLLFWLGNGIKPYGLSDDEFLMLRPICINLIAKKQLKPEALTIFDQ